MSGKFEVELVSEYPNPANDPVGEGGGVRGALSIVDSMVIIDEGPPERGTQGCH